MGRKIIMTGKNAQYVEHRGVNATPDNDREIRMEGDEAVYQEYAYGQAAQPHQEEKPTYAKNEEEKKLLTASGEYVEPMREEEVIERLKPIFFNNENDVRLFLKEISGMQPNNITDLVNTWVQDKRISDYGSSRKGNLWKILHDAKLYPRTIQNWNRRVF